MSIDKKEALTKIDRQAALAFLSRMVQFKSYSETEGEKELARFMKDRMTELGLEAYLQAVPGGRVNAIGHLRGKGGGKSLLFNGHLDTNPVGEGWTVDPWEGKVDDSFVYGIGVSNMKSGDAAYFMAVKTLVDAGIKLRGDVILTFVVGELQCGIGTLAAIEQGITADYFINSEPTDLAALTMHAAAFLFSVELVGDTRHMSKREQGVDALAAASALVPRLNALTFSGAPSAEHKSINRVHIGVLKAALGRNLQDWRAPQVADYAVLRGSGRYAPGQTEEMAFADIRRLLDQLESEFPGLRATLTADRGSGLPSMPAFQVAKDSRIVRAINSAYLEVRGQPQPTGAITPPGFYGTDAGHLYGRLGMEGIVCGPGGRYNTMPDERVDIADYIDMIGIYLLTILDICGIGE